MQFTPYLRCNGTCEEACKFYEQVLGAKIESLFRHPGTPMAEHVLPDWRSQVMHSSLMREGSTHGLRCTTRTVSRADRCTVSIQLNDRDGAERKLEALSKGSKRVMPVDILGPPFWYANRPICHSVAYELRIVFGDYDSAARGFATTLLLAARLTSD